MTSRGRCWGHSCCAENGAGGDQGLLGMEVQQHGAVPAPSCPAYAASEAFKAKKRTWSAISGEKKKKSPRSFFFLGTLDGYSCPAAGDAWGSSSLRCSLCLGLSRNMEHPGEAQQCSHLGFPRETGRCYSGELHNSCWIVLPVSWELRVVLAACPPPPAALPALCRHPF